MNLTREELIREAKAVLKYYKRDGQLSMHPSLSSALSLNFHRYLDCLEYDLFAVQNFIDNDGESLEFCLVSERGLYVGI